MVTIETGAGSSASHSGQSERLCLPMDAICASTSIDSDVGAIIPAATKLWSPPPPC